MSGVTITRPFYGRAADVEIPVGTASAVYCIAEIGSDTNAHGCFLNAWGDLLTAGTTAPDNVVVVNFRITVNRPNDHRPVQPQTSQTVREPNAGQ